MAWVALAGAMADGAQVSCCKCHGGLAESSPFHPWVSLLLPCDCFVRYTCASCGEAESLERMHVSWVDVVHMVLYYFIETRTTDTEVEGLKFYHWRSIAEEIEQYWPLLWDREKTGHWQTSVVATLATYSSERFRSAKEVRGGHHGFWTLIDTVAPVDLEGGLQRRTQYHVSTEGKLMPLDGGREEAPVQAGDTDRGKEREAKKLRKQARRLAACYVFSNLDFDRPNPPGSIAMSKLSTHTAPQIVFPCADDGWTASNAEGYAMARTTHGIDRGGQWYFEVVILPSTTNRGHVRAGVAQILGQTQAPVGFDEYSYGIKDTDGCIVHCAQSKQYLGGPIPPGSTLGVLVSLPHEWDAPEFDESMRSTVEAHFPPLKLGEYQVRQDVLAHGQVQFWVDGKTAGVAFRNIYHGKYYPAVSMFGGGKARLVLGPAFSFPPTSLDFQPVSSLSSK